MFVNRWFRFCNECSRVVSSSCGRRRGRRTLTERSTGKQPRRRFHGDLGDLHSNESVQKYLQQLMGEYTKLSKKLQQAHLGESERKALLKRQMELLPAASVFESVQQALKDQEEVMSLLQSKSNLTKIQNVLVTVPGNGSQGYTNEICNIGSCCPVVIIQL